MKDHFGQEDRIYEGARVKILPYFLYRVCIYKYWKFGFCVLSDRFFKSDQLLNIKNTNIIKYYKNYIIEAEVFLIGAPYEFIHNCPIYELKKSRKRSK